MPTLLHSVRSPHTPATGLAAAGVPSDPAPTAFVPGSKYELLMQAFGGHGASVATAEELQVGGWAQRQRGKSLLVSWHGSQFER